MMKKIKRILFALLPVVISLLPKSSFCQEILTVPSVDARTITEALVKARPGDTIILENNRYKEKIYIKAGVTIKARNLHKAIIDGGGHGTVVTMGSNSAIIGCVVTNGTIGIFSRKAGVTISRCMVIKNWLTGMIVVKHLPKIEDNIIAFNRGSGIQGWDVRSTQASINHNTIAYNNNHGIAIGGTSNIIVENNIIAYNERYGLKISEKSKKSRITKNNFYKNLNQRIPSGNYSFNPAFISPRAMLNFKLNPKLCCQIKGADNENLGVRFEY